MRTAKCATNHLAVARQARTIVPHRICQGELMRLYSVRPGSWRCEGAPVDCDVDGHPIICNTCRRSATIPAALGLARLEFRYSLLKNIINTAYCQRGRRQIQVFEHVSRLVRRLTHVYSEADAGAPLCSEPTSGAFACALVPSRVRRLTVVTITSIK